jgi:hypothetical protein
VTQPLACPKCKAQPGGPNPFDPDEEAEPFTLAIAYVASTEGLVDGRHDAGDMLVDWLGSKVIDRYLDRFLTCSCCEHTWRTQRTWATAPLD